ncbi:extensin-like [Helicoverpa zea]|uniref:extensin-like n=1 Tax=Helicoverpa zea TaxID=7113 RepID=UPI001F55DC48|nr:extensin-like [Helicoverpa zea]
MPTQLLSLLLLSVLWLGTGAEPAPAPEPGRVPKVYNALITSNQNLEPSKAFPVYQPVLHDAFAFSYQPAVFYGGDLLGNGLLPAPGLLPKPPQPPQVPQSPQPSESTPVSTPEAPAEPSAAPTESPTTTPEPAKPESDSKESTPAPPPPNTQSPIPLNEFGLPPQVLPLGHIDPLYNALPQFSPFAYRYPGVRFYDPYDPFGFSPYSSLPIYRPLTNVLGHSLPVIAEKPEPSNAASLASNGVSEQSAQTPPPEPSDLNILNYSSKDPAIPNVPPPPLPQGGLKTDKSE